MSTQIVPTLGSLRERLTLEARTRTPADGGAATVTWITVDSMFGHIRPIKGREIVSAGGKTARVTHQVLVRYNPDVQPGMHFVDGSRTLIIHSALDPDGRKRRLQCLCEERLP